MEYLFAFFLGSVFFYLRGSIPWLAAGLRELHRAQRVSRLGALPALRARSVREGPARLRGRVVAAGRTLMSPDSSRSCVAYEARTDWLGRVEVEATAFDLDDGTGVVRIEADRPALLAREESGLFGDRMRLVRPGDVVTVYGVASRVPDPVGPIADYRNGNARWVVRAAPGQPLLIARDRIRGLAPVAIGGSALASALALITFLVMIWQR